MHGSTKFPDDVWHKANRERMKACYDPMEKSIIYYMKKTNTPIDEIWDLRFKRKELHEYLKAKGRAQYFKMVADKREARLAKKAAESESKE